MSAGLVPFVVGEGGAPEFLRQGENGFMWHHAHELVRLTDDFLKSPAETQSRLRENARRTAAEFDEERFRARARQLLLTTDFMLYSASY